MYKNGDKLIGQVTGNNGRTILIDAYSGPEDCEMQITGPSTASLETGTWLYNLEVVETHETNSRCATLELRTCPETYSSSKEPGRKKPFDAMECHDMEHKDPGAPPGPGHEADPRSTSNTPTRTDTLLGPDHLRMLIHSLHEPNVDDWHRGGGRSKNKRIYRAFDYSDSGGHTDGKQRMMKAQKKSSRVK